MTTRRTVLRSLSAGGIAGLAGCAGLPGFGGGGDGPARPFTDWLYAPAVTRREHYPAMAVDPATIWSARGLLHPETYSAWTDPVAAANPPNLPVELIDRHVRFERGTVAVTGRFALGTVLDGLTAAGFTDRTTHEGYRVLVRSVAANGGIVWEAVGVTEGALVATRRGTRFGATLVLQAAIDAAVGRNPRYVTENPTFGHLAKHLTEATVATVETFSDLTGPQVLDADLAGLAGVGHGLVVDGEITRRRVVLVYGDAERADESAVRSWATEATPVGGDVPTRDVRLDLEGRTFVLAWEQPVRSVRDAFATSVGTPLFRTGWVEE